MVGWLAGWLAGWLMPSVLQQTHDRQQQLEAAEAAAEGMGTTGGSGATMGTVDLEALQAEHDAMAQELAFLREVCARGCDVVVYR